MRFRVDLDIFSGPLDLLYYLVRKHELDILDIPIARVIDQYLQMLEVIEQIDVNAVGDFLELASRLIEIKSRLALPRHEEDEEEEAEDPRHDLVQRLLEYKKYKDAASVLDERGQLWRRRFSRRGSDLPTRVFDPAEQPIHEVELWDLVGAFGRVMREHAATQPANIRTEEVPIEVYMQRIRTQLAASPRLAFERLFEGDVSRMQLVGLFLALLELIRHEYVQVEQEGLFGNIWVLAGEPIDRDQGLTVVSNDADPAK